VNKSLLNVVLHDQSFEHNGLSPALLSAPPATSKSAKRIEMVVNTINQSPDKPTEIALLGGAAAVRAPVLTVLLSGRCLSADADQTGSNTFLPMIQT
jgi:hypothetical protein